MNLKRKDDVVFSAEFTDETSSQTQLAGLDVIPGGVQRGSGPQHQLPLLHFQQVVHGEETWPLQQVSRDLLEILQRSGTRGPRTRSHRVKSGPDPDAESPSTSLHGAVTTSIMMQCLCQTSKGRCNTKAETGEGGEREETGIHHVD